MSGVLRNQLLQSAYEKFDAPRTALLFNAFKATRPAPPAPVADPQKELQRQVAPGTTQASTPPTRSAASERIWTSREIDRFYTDVAKGLYSGAKKAEAVQIEAEIDAALQSNRVRN